MAPFPPEVAMVDGRGGWAWVNVIDRVGNLVHRVHNLSNLRYFSETYIAG